MNALTSEKTDYPLKAPKDLSPRIQWLRDYYFQGAKRAWNNEFTAWSTGTDWDLQYQELTYYIVPEVYMLLDTFRAGDGYIMAASADGRARGQFLSNAICPTNGADIHGPTSNTNSVGKVLGEKSRGGPARTTLTCCPTGRATRSRSTRRS